MNGLEITRVVLFVATDFIERLLQTILQIRAIKDGTAPIGVPRDDYPNGNR